MVGKLNNRTPTGSGGGHWEIAAELWSEKIAIRRIAGLCGAAGHSNRGFAQPQGGGRKAEFSLLVIRCPVGGMAKGAKTPWLRSLPTFCRITESRSPRGSSGLKEKD